MKRKDVINKLVESEILENIDSKILVKYVLKDLLLNGFKGYENYTNEELKYSYKEDFSEEIEIEN
jgi:hypothetical protein